MLRENISKDNQENFKFSSKYRNILLTQSLMLMTLSNAFVSCTRESIRQRASDASELDKKFSDKVFYLQAAHIDHRRSIDDVNNEENTIYNSPTNGYLLTVAQHHANLIGGPEVQGGIDHWPYTCFRADQHLKESVIYEIEIEFNINSKKCLYIPPKWDIDNKDKYGTSISNRYFFDNIGAILYPSEKKERKEGIANFLVPLRTILKGKPKLYPIYEFNSYETYREAFNCLNIPPRETLMDGKFITKW